MKLFAILILFLVSSTVFAQTTILKEVTLGNDSTIATSAKSISDTATTKDWLTYGTGNNSYQLKGLVYFNGAWSDTITISTSSTTTAPFVDRVTTITTDSLKNHWLGFISPRPYSHTILKAKSGWLYKLVIQTDATGNSSNVLSVDENL